MPSRRKRRLATKSKSRAQTGSQKRSYGTKKAQHVAFFPLLILSVVFWFIYRGVFQFPVFFDELIGKAIFFGLPVWLYILVSGYREIADTFAPYKMKRGLMMGIAIGGLYGFVATFLAVLQSRAIYPSFAFLTNQFWLEFIQALLTGFWEKNS